MPTLNRVACLVVLVPSSLIMLPGAAEGVVPPAPAEVPVSTNWAVRVNGVPVPVYSAMVFHGDHAHDVTIRGRGVIDMTALDWHSRCAIHFNACSNVHIEGVTILDGPRWTVLVSQSDDVVIENVKLIGHRQGNDG